jgi:hypothetical protein
VAHDPFVRQGYSNYVDTRKLRYRRILVPLAAWLLAFGRPAWIDAAYIALEMFFVALGAYWCARLFSRRGRSPFWGLLFVIVPATLASFDRMLVDGALAALFAGFLLYCEERRWTSVWVLAMLAALTRETGLLLPAALVADRLWHRNWRRAAWFASSAVPAGAWYAYLTLRLPPDWAFPQFAIPGWNILLRLSWFRPYPVPQVQLLLRVTDFLAVLGLIFCLLLTVWWLLKLRVSPITLCAALFAVLALLLASVPSYMDEAFGFARPVSPLLLWIVVEAVSRKKWAALAPPLLLSLSVSLVFLGPLVVVMKGLLGR